MGDIPQSQALTEVSNVDSLAELFSRDPEGFQEQDLARVVAAYRLMREKWQAGEAAKPEKIAGGKGKAELIKQTPKSAEDIGL